MKTKCLDDDNPRCQFILQIYFLNNFFKIFICFEIDSQILSIIQHFIVLHNIVNALSRK